MKNTAKQTSDATSRLEQAFTSIRRVSDRKCRVGLILGSGLGGIADKVENSIRIPFETIDQFPVSTAPGHEGALILGDLFDCPVALLQGRFHLYEGWNVADIAVAVRTLKNLGADTLIITNAAGALNETYQPGELMLISDHLNFTGENPLIGSNDDSVGLRFPDMSRAYTPELLSLAQRVLSDNGIDHHLGIYAGVVGPSLETSAERRFYRNAGADAIGMSTVIEVIAAVHAGSRVLGMSAITNVATGSPDQAPDTIEDVFENAVIAGRKIEQSLRHLLPLLAEAESIEA